MGSKQSSSIDFKKHRSVRKLSQDFTVNDYFTVSETFETNHSIKQLKRPLS